MTDAAKFFEDNIRVLPSPTSGDLRSHLDHNLYRGLYALAQQQVTLLGEVQRLRRELQQLQNDVARLRSSRA